MKNILLATPLAYAFFIPDTAFATSHNIVVGISGNYLHMNNNLKTTVSHPLDGKTCQNAKINKTTYSPGGLLGYRFQAEKKFFESTYEYSYDRLKKQRIYNQFSLNMSVVGLTTAMDAPVVKFKHQGTHTLAFKAGRSMTESINAYFKVSGLYSRFNINIERNGYSKSYHRYGFAPGIGFEKIIMPALSLRLEYNYRIYQRIKTKDLPVLKTAYRDAVYSSTIKIREHHVGLSLVYKFNLSK